MKALAYLLIGLGILVCAGYGLYGFWLFFTEAGIPLPIRLGIGALAAGFLVLVLALWRERAKEGDKG